MSLIGDIRAPDPRPNRPPVPVPLAGLDRLMPMAVVVSQTGHISHAGPTLAKLRPAEALVGQRFLEVFEMRRPRNVTSFSDLAAVCNGPMKLQFRTDPQTSLNGAGALLPDQDGLVINLSFGIGIVEALGVYDLNNTDFASTDLTMELLYLVEANTLVHRELARLNHQLHGAKSQAEEMAHTDTLTGLRNRRALDHALELYTRGDDPFAVMQMDLDFFKQVNDELGHDAGEAVLRHVADILRQETREVDTIVRAGGDEFVLIFHGITEREILSRVASRLLQRIQEPLPYKGEMCRISGSIGIAASRDYAAADASRMLLDADAALYISKNAGRAQFSFAPGEDRAAPK